MRRVALLTELQRVRPDVTDPSGAIAEGRVLVDGRTVTNARSMVRPGCAIVVAAAAAELRGSVKLRAALDSFTVAVEGRVCLDVGAAAGGFTTVLLERGAGRVYAVDAGHGQLLGSLRQDPRVVNLEATNLGNLDARTLRHPIDLVAIDVSYLSLASAAGQLHRIDFAPRADLVGLVKPMFELRLAAAPSDRVTLDAALERAVRGIAEAGWRVLETIDSPVTGAKGAPELFVHARGR